jgi:chromosome partitioning protein
MRTIAVAIHKGGVGRTTTAVNLAAGLAREGLRTLLVDCDAQSDATFWFVDDPDTLDYDLEDVVSKGAPIDKVTREPGSTDSTF